MTDPEAAVRYLIDRYLRKARMAPGGLGSPDDAALDALHEAVTAALGRDSALTQLETAVARLRKALHDAVDANPQFATDLRTALAAVRWGSGRGGMGGGLGPGGGFGPGAGGIPARGGGYDTGYGPGGQAGYAVEDVWVEEPDQEEPPDSSGWSPRT